MRIFLDTNVFMEYVQKRSEYKSIGKIFDSIEDENIDSVTSSSTICTLTYLITRALKETLIHKPEQTKQLRQALNYILDLAKVVDIPHKNVVDAVNDERFTDIEDSLQFHCAKSNQCDAIVTINKKDFLSADDPTLPILTPKEFVKQYL